MSGNKITFVGGGLERAAHLRSLSVRNAGAALDDPEARILPFWRGKVAMAGEPVSRLGWLFPDQNGLDASECVPFFLGLDNGRPRYALDMHPWEPEGPLPSSIDKFSDPSMQTHPAFPDDHTFVELRANMTRLSPFEAEAAATGRALIQWHSRHRFCANCGAPTEVSEGGWQRKCPACTALHYPRVDPVVIMLITHRNSVLVGRSPGWPEGMYSLLAGFVEPGETPEDAVRREVLEEAAIRVGGVRYLASQPWPFPSSLMMAFRGRAESTEIKVDPAELEDARWISREDMADVMAGAHPELKAARQGAIARWALYEWLADRLPEIGT